MSTETSLEQARPGGARRWKQLMVVSLIGLCALFAGLVIKMAMTRSRQPPKNPGSIAAPISSAEQQAMAEHLAAAVRIPTISLSPLQKDASAVARSAQAFTALHAYLQSTFPLLHAALEREAIASDAAVPGQALLYTWRGSDGTLPPYLLAAHQDVVPVEPGTESRWQQPPFSGALVDGHIWGRGALDDKFSLIGIMEAIERLIKSGYKPKRTLYIGSGHDEEVGGSGAQAITARLAQRGVRVEFALDEGMALVEGMLPGLSQPVALIGLAEKGSVTIEVAVRSQGGHSSMPPTQTAAGILAAALTRLETHQLPVRLSGAPRLMFEHLAPEMPPALRLLMTNLWLFEPVLHWQLAQRPSTNALVRTTTAITMLEGSPKENVLPQRARAYVNFRILPGDSVQAVLEHVRKTVADPRVEVQIAGGRGNEPSTTSSADSPAFARIAQSIRDHFPDAVVAPSLMIGASDVRHYAAVADNAYRFMPILFRPDDLARFHGTDERIAIADFARVVAFYEHFIRQNDEAR
ncbi:MAG: M20 family peptidase [Myxococcales bacterium]|nr:M20 family peptidase [Myxococcales bacterium]